MELLTRDVVIQVPAFVICYPVLSFIADPFFILALVLPLESAHHHFRHCVSVIFFATHSSKDVDTIPLILFKGFYLAAILASCWTK